MKVLIDQRVHYVGMTALRRLKFDALPQDEIWVLQDRGHPVSVLVPYALYVQMQSDSTALTNSSLRTSRGPDTE